MTTEGCIFTGRSSIVLRPAERCHWGDKWRKTWGDPSCAWLTAWWGPYSEDAAKEGLDVAGCGVWFMMCVVHTVSGVPVGLVMVYVSGK